MPRVALDSPLAFMLVLQNVLIGLTLGFAIGWGAEEALVIAGITGISSSAMRLARSFSTASALGKCQPLRPSSPT